MTAPPEATTWWRRPAVAYAVALVVIASFRPFIGFLADNVHEPVAAPRVLGYAALVAIVALAATALVARLLRGASVDRVAVGVAAVVTSFFSASLWLEPNPVDEHRTLQGIAWVVITALFAVLTYRASRSSGFRTWVLATLALWLVIGGAAYPLERLGGSEAGELASGGDPGDEVRPAPGPQPNVYFFLLDFYARNDVLEGLVGFDNDGFHRDLEARDFVVADEALASYPVTALSTMSTFEMGYPATEPDQFVGGVRRFEHFIRGENQVVDRFRRLGYGYVYSPNGTFSFGQCSTALADHCIPADDRGASLDELELELVGMTPLGPLDLFTRPRTDPVYVVDQLEAIEDLERPFFLFAHVISPHPPYRYDEGCGLRPRPVERLSLTREQEKDHYRIEIGCVNDLLIEAVDRILTEDPDAIVVVQSDHGSEFLTTWDVPLDGWSDEALIERYGVQHALRLPARCRDDVGPATPIVNSFRIVFACLEGREPELLPHRAFFWRWLDDENIIELPEDRLRSSYPDQSG